MGWLGFAVVALCACGRIGFDARSDGALDPPDDAEAPHVVQHASDFIAGGMDVTVALPSPVTAQNLVLVLASTSQTNQLFPPTDSQGNTYALVAEVASPDANDARMALYAATVGGGALSVTCQDDATVDNLHCHLYEVHGVTTTIDALGLVDDLDSASLSVSTSTPTSRPDSFLIAYFAANNTQGVFTAGPGYGDPETTDSPSNDIAFSEVAFATSVGIQTATATTTISDHFICMLVALKNR